MRDQDAEEKFDKDRIHQAEPIRQPPIHAQSDKSKHQKRAGDQSNGSSARKQGRGEQQIEQHFERQGPTDAQDGRDLALADASARNEQQRSHCPRHGDAAMNRHGSRQGQHRDLYERGEPVHGHNANEAAAQKYSCLAPISPMRSCGRHHDEAADGEKNIHAGLTPGQIRRATQAAIGDQGADVMHDHHHRRHATQDLDASELHEVPLEAGAQTMESKPLAGLNLQNSKMIQSIKNIFELFCQVAIVAPDMQTYLSSYIMSGVMNNVRKSNGV